MHLTGQKLESGIEKCFDGIHYLDISRKKSGYGYDISIMSCLMISHDMGYDRTIYSNISCDFTPDHLETPAKYKIN